MNQETRKIIEEKINSLPKEIREAISSAEVGGRVAEIAKKYEILLDQADNLYLEVSLTMIGLEPLEDFVENLVKNLGVTKEKAELIAIDMNTIVFQPIRNSLQTPKSENVSIRNNSREQILNEIENPTPTNSVNAAQTSKALVVETPEEEAIVMMRQKMTKPTSNPMQHVVIKETPTVQAAPKINKPYTADPYRETI